MSYDPAQPYNELPRLPPNAELESTHVLKLCIEARVRLAELKLLANELPNQTMLINTIPLLEAKASSEIENIVTTSDRLFRFSGGSDLRADPATKETLRYRTALRKGYELLQTSPLCTNIAIRICRTLRGVDIGIRKLPGTYIGNTLTREIYYTPPVGEDNLRGLLSNWERFLHEEQSLDPLVRMAVGHYQFEAIHPFDDGNGRTGRILNLLYLCEQKLLNRPVLFLSGYILQHRSQYYALLRAVTSQADWTNWILYMLEAVRQKAGDTSMLIRSMIRLQKETGEYIKRRARRIYSYELVEQLFVQPYCRIANLVDAGIAKRQTASLYLQELCSLGVLSARRFGREKIFLNARLLELLFSDEFEYQRFAG